MYDYIPTETKKNARDAIGAENAEYDAVFVLNDETLTMAKGNYDDLLNIIVNKDLPKAKLLYSKVDDNPVVSRSIAAYRNTSTGELLIEFHGTNQAFYTIKMGNNGELNYDYTGL